MKPANARVPETIQELLETLTSMLLKAPKFLDKTGYFPYYDLDYFFRELSGGLSYNRQSLGEERYKQLTQMSDRMRAHFEADPDDKTGETLIGCKIIHQMEDVLRQVRRTR